MAKEKKNKNIEKIEELEEVEETVVVEDEEEYVEKEITIMDMLNRIFVCLIVIAIILAINTIVLICKDESSSSKEETRTSETSNSGGSGSGNGSSNVTCIDGYDTSMMEEVDVDKSLALFDDKGTYVLYVGRCDCGACASYLPSLQKAQNDYDFKTQYLDLNKVDFSTESFSKLVTKLSVKYDMKDSSGKTVTDTFGNWMGYTPMTIIIKDGKQVDGEIGAIDYSTLTKMLEKNGIKEK